MRDQLQKFAEAFSMQLDKMSFNDNEQRKVNNPILFLFIGDQVKDALKSIKQINEDKWQNSSGVLYFHAYQTESACSDQNIFSTQLPASSQDRKNKRKSLFDAFYQDEKKLIEFNSTFRRLSSTVSVYGKVYSSLQKANLCVVTAVDDPANILIQEITLLLKSILQETFKTVDVDLYCLLKEKQDGGGFAYSTSFGISFLMELERYQRDTYTFDQELQVTEDFLKLPVHHSPGPLFDLVYLLSDKNENGLISSEAVYKNYEIISNLNLLKNRRMITDYNEKMDSYNNANFRRAIQGSSTEFAYASAGFSKVKRPNKAIALHAALYLYDDFMAWLKENSVAARETVLDLFELSESSLQRMFHKFLPPLEKLDDMNGLIGAPSTFQHVKKMTVREAEDSLYGDGAARFFQANFQDPVAKRLTELQLKEKIEKCLTEKVLNNEKYGLYCAYIWTAASSSDSEISLIKEIRKLITKTKKEIGEAEVMLEQQYQQTVDACVFKRSYLPFSDKKNLQSFLHYFFETVYGIKYQMIELNVKLAILNQYHASITDSHQLLSKEMEEVKQVGAALKQAGAASLDDADEYLCQNIPEYYTGIVSKLAKEQREKHGPGIFADDRFFGNLFRILQAGGAPSLLSRLLLVCDREILSREEFHRTFEDELLERANVRAQYDNRDILSKEDLFKQLFQRLYDHSAIQIQVYNYTQEHRYEEKYFFGDFYSQFIQYAIDKDSQSRHIKVGCVHEKKSSGIEKLSIMGGFHLKDLMYYRNGEKYYQKYQENGFEFHVESVGSMESRESVDSRESLESKNLIR